MVVLMVEQQQRGCYVYYPFEYLLAILKIESVPTKSWSLVKT